MTPVLAIDQSARREAFDEFLSIDSAARSDQDLLDVWADLRLSFAECDGEGSGYIPLRDLMIVVDRHVSGDSGMYVDSNLSDDQLFTIFRKSLDVSMLQNDCANMAHEEMWILVTHELNDLRRQQKWQKAYVGALWRPAETVAATCQASEPYGRCRPGQHVARTHQVLNMALVNFSGEHMMPITIVPTCLVRELKDQLQKATGLLASRQILVFDGQVLCHQDHTLLEAGFRDGASLTVAVRKELKVDYVTFSDKLVDYL